MSAGAPQANDVFDEAYDFNIKDKKPDTKIVKKKVGFLGDDPPRGEGSASARPRFSRKKRFQSKKVLSEEEEREAKEHEEDQKEKLAEHKKGILTLFRPRARDYSRAHSAP